eukprot:TRINITY_DN7677_c0_g2_i1.p1 TRINITY_DN7677_c0_g2~~TRINITY_DN7677_c0_g2_i1.p1  ORF type:complete len:2702 (-),score=655.08 TRINITY_DN7677_c0_g2_i1:38-8143(-)
MSRSLTPAERAQKGTTNKKKKAPKASNKLSELTAESDNQSVIDTKPVTPKVMRQSENIFELDELAALPEKWSGSPLGVDQVPSKEDFLKFVANFPHRDRISYCVKLAKKHKNSPQLKSLIDELLKHPDPPVVEVDSEEGFTELFPPQQRNVPNYYDQHHLALLMASVGFDKNQNAPFFNEIHSKSNLFKKFSIEEVVRRSPKDDVIVNEILRAAPKPRRRLIQSAIKHRRTSVVDAALQKLTATKEGIEVVPQFLHGASPNVISTLLKNEEIEKAKINWMSLSTIKPRVILDYLLTKLKAAKADQYNSVWSEVQSRVGAVAFKNWIFVGGLEKEIVSLFVKYPVYASVVQFTETGKTFEYINFPNFLHSDPTILFRLLKRCPKEILNIVFSSMHLKNSESLVSPLMHLVFNGYQWNVSLDWKYIKSYYQKLVDFATWKLFDSDYANYKNTISPNGHCFNTMNTSQYKDMIKLIVSLLQKVKPIEPVTDSSYDKDQYKRNMNNYYAVHVEYFKRYVRKVDEKLNQLYQEDQKTLKLKKAKYLNLLMEASDAFLLPFKKTWPKLCPISEIPPNYSYPDYSEIHQCFPDESLLKWPAVWLKLWNWTWPYFTHYTSSYLKTYQYRWLPKVVQLGKLKIEANDGFDSWGQLSTQIKELQQQQFDIVMIQLREDVSLKRSLSEYYEFMSSFLNFDEELVLRVFFPLIDDYTLACHVVTNVKSNKWREKVIYRLTDYYVANNRGYDLLDKLDYFVPKRAAYYDEHHRFDINKLTGLDKTIQEYFFNAFLKLFNKGKGSLSWISTFLGSELIFEKQKEKIYTNIIMPNLIEYSKNEFSTVFSILQTYPITKQWEAFAILLQPESKLPESNKDQILEIQDIRNPKVRNALQKMANSSSLPERQKAMTALCRATTSCEEAQKQTEVIRTLRFMRNKIKNETYENRCFAIQLLERGTLVDGSQLKELLECWNDLLTDALEAPDIEDPTSSPQNHRLFSIFCKVANSAVKNATRKGSQSREKFNEQWFNFGIEFSWRIFTERLGAKKAAEQWKIDFDWNHKQYAKNPMIIKNFIQKLLKVYEEKTSGKVEDWDTYDRCSGLFSQKWSQIPALVELIDRKIKKAKETLPKDPEGLYIIENNHDLVMLHTVCWETVKSDWLEKKVEEKRLKELEENNKKKKQKPVSGYRRNRAPKPNKVKLPYTGPLRRRGYYETADKPKIMQELDDFILHTRKAPTIIWRLLTESESRLKTKREKILGREAFILKLLSISPSAIHLKFVHRHLIKHRQDILANYVLQKKSYRGVFYVAPEARMIAVRQKAKSEKTAAPKQPVRAARGRAKPARGARVVAPAVVSEAENVKAEIEAEQKMLKDLEEVDEVRKDHPDFFNVQESHGLYRLPVYLMKRIAFQWKIQAFNEDRAIPDRASAIARWTLLTTTTYSDVVQFYNTFEKEWKLGEKVMKPLPVNIIESALRGVIVNDEPVAPLNYLMSTKFLSTDRARVAIYSISSSLPYLPEGSFDKIIRLLLTGERRNGLKITSYKEIIRLLASSPTDRNVATILHEWTRKELHRDVRISILRAAFKFLNSSSLSDQQTAWKIIESASDVPDPEVLVAFIGVKSNDYKEVTMSNYSSSVTKPRLLEFASSFTKEKIPATFVKRFVESIIKLAKTTTDDDVRFLCAVVLQGWSFNNTIHTDCLSFYIELMLKSIEDDSSHLYSENIEQSKVYKNQFTSLMRDSKVFDNVPSRFSHYTKLGEVLLKKFLSFSFSQQRKRHNLTVCVEAYKTFIGNFSQCEQVHALLQPLINNKYELRFCVDQLTRGLYYHESANATVINFIVDCLDSYPPCKTNYKSMTERAMDFFNSKDEDKKRLIINTLIEKRKTLTSTFTTSFVNNLLLKMITPSMVFSSSFITIVEELIQNQINLAESGQLVFSLQSVREEVVQFVSKIFANKPSKWKDSKIEAVKTLSHKYLTYHKNFLIDQTKENITGQSITKSSSLSDLIATDLYTSFQHNHPLIVTTFKTDDLKSYLLALIHNQISTILKDKKPEDVTNLNAMIDASKFYQIINSLKKRKMEFILWVASMITKPEAGLCNKDFFVRVMYIVFFKFTDIFDLKKKVEIEPIMFDLMNNHLPTAKLSPTVLNEFVGQFVSYYTSFIQRYSLTYDPQYKPIRKFNDADAERIYHNLVVQLSKTTPSEKSSVFVKVMSSVLSSNTDCLSSYLPSECKLTPQITKDESYKQIFSVLYNTAYLLWKQRENNKVPSYFTNVVYASFDIYKICYAYYAHGDFFPLQEAVIATKKKAALPSDLKKHLLIDDISKPVFSDFIQEYNILYFEKSYTFYYSNSVSKSPYQFLEYFYDLEQKSPAISSFTPFTKDTFSSRYIEVFAKSLSNCCTYKGGELVFSQYVITDTGKECLFYFAKHYESENNKDPKVAHISKQFFVSWFGQSSTLFPLQSLSRPALIKVIYDFIIINYISTGPSKWTNASFSELQSKYNCICKYLPNFRDDSTLSYKKDEINVYSISMSLLNLEFLPNDVNDSDKKHLVSRILSCVYSEIGSLFKYCYKELLPILIAHHSYYTQSESQSVFDKILNSYTTFSFRLNSLSDLNKEQLELHEKERTQILDLINSVINIELNDNTKKLLSVVYKGVFNVEDFKGICLGLACNMLLSYAPSDMINEGRFNVWRPEYLRIMDDLVAKSSSHTHIRDNLIQVQTYNST